MKQLRNIETGSVWPYTKALAAKPNMVLVVEKEKEDPKPKAKKKKEKPED